MSLTILMGPMFAGKSSRILSLISRYAALDTPVLVVKHADDTRYSRNEIATHDGQRAPCISVRDLDDLRLDDWSRFKVIIVDEAQFFHRLVPFVEWAVDTHGKHLYLVGLDGDSNRRPFGELLQCIPLADTVERLTAFCRRCANGTPAPFTYRRSGPHDQQVIVGGQDRYMALCRECYHMELVRETTAS
jgi:thymidine kinase